MGAIGARPAGAQIAVNVGQEGGERAFVQRLGLQNAGIGGGDIQVFALRRFFQGGKFVGVEIRPPIGLGPDWGGGIGHRGGESDGHVARPIQGRRIGGGAARREQRNHTDRQAAK